MTPASSRYSSVFIREIHGQKFREQLPEFRREHRLHFRRVDFPAKLRLHGGDRAVRRADTAGHDALEMVEIDIHVEGEAVVRYPAAHGHAEGGDFARTEPEAGLSLPAPRGEAQ